jgi:hypothetical protein
MKQAWEYTHAYIDADISATAGLRSYREAGGLIRTQDWYTLWNQASASDTEWGTLGYLSPTDSVPERMYELVDLSFQRKYVVNFGASVRMEDGTVLPEVYRYVESDHRLTWGEALRGFEKMLKDYPQLTGMKDFEIYDVRFYERTK